MVVLYDHALARARRWRGVSSVCFLGILLVSRGPPPDRPVPPPGGLYDKFPPVSPLDWKHELREFFIFATIIFDGRKRVPPLKARCPRAPTR